MKIQIAKIIFHTALSVMKKVLDLIAFKYQKNSDDYKFFKKQIMDYFYGGLKELFVRLEDDKILDRCHCKANLRNGYKPCEKCGGSGYKNKEIEKVN